MRSFARKSALLALPVALALGMTLPSEASAATNWTRTESWGWARGTYSVTEVKGTVTDTAGDYACAQVVVKWKRGGGLIDTDFSPLACPKGDTDGFSMVPGDGGIDTYATSAEITIRKTT